MEANLDEKEWAVLLKFQTASENFDSAATGVIVTEFLFLSGIMPSRIDWDERFYIEEENSSVSSLELIFPIALRTYEQKYVCFLVPGS